MKIDLHCHSKYSKRPSLWLMQKIGCPESFTEPLELYALAREKGMDAVTITDHNVIDGALEIAHLPNTFLGCEYTTYFPEDRCKVHVLAYNFSEAQHGDLSKARENIYDFVAYLREHRLPHICAHPLFAVNDRLTPDHLEKLALLFKYWERNGDQCPEMNAILDQLVAGLTPEIIARLVDKHGIAPPFPDPWHKFITAGSDDHGSLHLATAWTEVTGAATVEDFWTGFHEGRLQIHCPATSPEAFARNVYGIAYQFYKNKLGVERHVNKDLFLRFLDRMLQNRPQVSAPWLDRVYFAVSRRRRPAQPAANASLLSVARFEAEKLIRHDAQLSALIDERPASDAGMDQHWFSFVEQVGNKVLAHQGEQLLDKLVRARFFDLFHSIGSAGALYALLAPYFVSFSHFRQQARLSRNLMTGFAGGAIAPAQLQEARIAHFTDTFAEVNGVARTLQQQLATARALNKPYTVFTCLTENSETREGLASFPPVGAWSVPEYPELKLLMPPFLDMLKRCYEEQYTHIHLATPGPVGLAGLAIARILQLPVSATYHTALPQYARALTGDTYVEDLMWKGMVWFYDQMDWVYVPSRATGAELIEKGIRAEKIRVYPRGVDTLRFHPGRRNNILRDQFGIEDKRVNLLYVGRVSREKGLDILAAAYARYLEAGGDARLIITGDGPYRAEMEEALRGTPALFTGYLEGDALPAVYASADVLVFPSATDTFGNVVLEAQASGLPVIVVDQGGPQENVEHGQTGLVVSAGNVDALLNAMLMLAEDEALRGRMRVSARASMEHRSFARAFARLWDLYTMEANVCAPFSVIPFNTNLIPITLAS
ncbi:MAG: glycosyltransferase [Candidatus Hydrogenedentes bacterium]|nr:glycosyltransferase [Candidatus Hydrogenedentota bacterium]